ncbi:MAG TPA: CaiB/BaiF CoA-transferase family protein, partial [Rhodocyclaceae bacterium]|nr:CaiB/BaiF CoA-transferase family protein [Rhodocyclaceae bacterium]
NDGPYRDKKAYDLLIQSEAGLLSVTGTPEEPAKAGISIADISAGMYAYSSILAALLLREKTGQGQLIDISLLETLGEWMGYPMYYAYQGQTPPPRAGAAHATIYPYGPFRTGDGKTVMMGLQNEREWAEFCKKVLLRPELVTDPRFDANVKRSQDREPLKRLIEEIFASLTAEQVVERLDAAGIANARVNTLEEFWQHPQLAARGRWREMDVPGGRSPTLLPPGNWQRGEPRLDPVPALGEHTEAILDELGYGASDIAALRAEGAI